MRKSTVVVVLLFGLSLLGYTQEQTGDASTAKKSATKAKAAGVPDKALMQTIWDAWTTLDPENAAKYYAKGPGHVFFDITPLKYDGWDAYKNGAAQVLSGFQSLKATINDDAQFHRQGNLVWGFATVHHQDVMKDGSKGEGDFRWTPVWQKTGNEWLIVHEHISAPMGGGAPAENK